MPQPVGLGLLGVDLAQTSSRTRLRRLSNEGLAWRSRCWRS